MTKKYQINSINEQKSSIRRFYDGIKFDSDQPTNPCGTFWDTELDQEYTFLHYHQCLEIGITYEGSGIFHINEKSIRFEGPTISIIFPTTFHSAHRICKEKCKWNFVYINSEFLLEDDSNDTYELKQFENFFLIISKEKNKELFSVIETFINISCRDFKNRSLLLSNLLKTIFCLISEYQKDTKNNFDMETFDIILPAINYINQNYDKKITNEELAHICHISLSSLRRKFIEITKYSPYEYIERTRIKIAKNLLRSNDKIAFIAYRCGYQSISCFNKKFKKIVNISPKAYQKKVLNKKI